MKTENVCPHLDDPKTITEKVRALLNDLSNKEYKLLIFDNVPEFRYDFLCFHPSHPNPATIFHLSYPAFASLLSKASPGLSKTYEGLTLQICELNKQRLEILHKLSNWIEFPVAK